MTQKYYLDTSIYIDYFEDRTDKFRPLGDWAHRLLALIKAQNEILLVSDFLIDELENHFSKKDIDEILETCKDIIEKIEFNEEQFTEAKEIANKRKLPKGDVLHAIIARDNNALLITRDHHFEELTDVAEPIKPEDII